MGVWTPGPGATDDADTFIGDETNEAADGLGGDDTLNGAAGDDTLTGALGDDRLDGGAGDDALFGGDGDDLVFTGSGVDTVDGGAGIDHVVIDRSGAAESFSISTAEFASGMTLSDGATIINFERFSFTAGSGSDTFYITAPIVAGGIGQLLDGGAGVDALVIDQSASVTPFVFPDISLRNIEQYHILGGSADDEIAGLPGDDSVSGGLGDDIIQDMGGNDFLYGLDGNDIIFSVDGTDLIEGGEGNDNLTGVSGHYVMLGDGGDDNLRGGSGDDLLLGGDGNDTLLDSGGANMLDGEAGNDYLWGGSVAGFDALLGGDGDDVIFEPYTVGRIEGGAGNDAISASGGAASGTIDGGDGIDQLFGAGDFSNIALIDIESLGTDFLVTGTAEQFENFEIIRGSNEFGVAFLELSQPGVLDLADELGDETGWVVGSSGDDVVRTGAGNDTLTGRAGADRLEGAGGDDWFVLTVAADGVDQIFGGVEGADAGLDTLEYSTAAAGVIVQLSGWSTTGGGALLANFSGIEAAVGSAFNDSLIGDAGNNRIDGRGGADWLVGAGGDDWFVQDIDIQAGVIDRLFGGTPAADSGFDTIDYSSAGAPVTVQLSGYAASAGAVIALFTGIEGAVGTLFNDTLVGNAANNRLTGGAGDDWLVGAAGDDTFVQGIEAGSIDRLFGDAGMDTLDYSGAGAAVTVQLSGYSTSDDVTLATFTGIEAAVGTAFDDAIIGSAANNRIAGAAGSDWLVGAGGDDWFVQGTESGVDRLFGDAGTDTIDYSGAASGVTVQLNGWSTVIGGATLATFTSIENAVGSAFSDALIGSALDNRIAGGAGADWLVGGAGNDTFVQGIEAGGVDRIFGDAGTDALDYSGAGAGVVVQLSGYSASGGVTLATFAGVESAIGSAFNDALIGDAADNSLIGGAGGDWLVGAAGADTFVYRSIADGAGDSIRAFSQLENDLIDLSAIDADPTTGGDDFFSFATVRHAGVAGEAVVTNFGASSLVSLHLDADDVADMAILVVHAQGVILSMEDFVL